MFVCVLRIDGSPLDERDLLDLRQRMSRAGGHITVSVNRGPFGALAASRVGCAGTSPSASQAIVHGGAIGVGDVRLTNRAALQLQLLSSAPVRSDLELASRWLIGHGSVRDLVGDYAFVLWSESTGVLTASRDAFGVRALFYAASARSIVIASHLSLVADERAIDESYVADFLAGGDISSDRTIWANACTVPGGHTLTVRGRVLSVREFWSAAEFEPSTEPARRSHVEEFGAALSEAVRVHIDDARPTWAEMSGGLDSSSIVTLAHSLAARGEAPRALDGTITLFDELGTGDERRYSDLLATHLALRNEIIANAWAWQDDGEEPPCTDEPRLHYPFFARMRRVMRVLRDAGCEVLLSGLGAEFYLLAKRGYLSDWLADGRYRAVLADLAHWAVASRRSVWRTCVDELLLPRVPRPLRPHLCDPAQRTPAWIDRKFARRMEFAARFPVARQAAVPRGRAFVETTAADVRVFGGWLMRDFHDAGIDLRYPFLHRPLAGLGLRLPLSARSRPGATKWVLREALGGILPEEIRTRQGKGGIDSRIAWSLGRERRRLEDILRDPVLGRIGAVDPPALRAAVGAAARGSSTALVPLMCALALETWFYVRSGRWTVPEHPDRGVPAGISGTPGDTRR
ncbi:MAG TPA: asparagine synthase-related protein [Gemmatimonadaceae bacterium]